jgi:hypothetical protein
MPFKFLFKLLRDLLPFRAICEIFFDYFEFLSDLAMQLDEGVVEEKCGFELFFEEAAFPPQL